MSDGSTFAAKGKHAIPTIALPVESVNAVYRFRVDGKWKPGGTERDGWGIVHGRTQ